MRKPSTFESLLITIVLVLIVLAFVTTCSAQVTTGIPPYQSFGGGPDVINLSNLNVHYSIPVFSRAGRGMPFSYALAYDSSIWTPGAAWVPNANWGLHRDTAALVGYVNYSQTYRQCRYGDGSTGDVYHWFFSAYVDPTGTSHPINIRTSIYDCINQDNSSGSAVSTATSLDDPVATSLGATGIALSLAQKNAGLIKGAAEAIPVLGQFVAGGSVLWDGWNAIQDYRKCVAGGD